MQRSDYLNPESMKRQCDKAVRRLKEDNDALETVRKSIRSISGSTGIKSEAFDALKRQLRDYETITEGMKAANTADISDFQSLHKALGNEVLDGGNILNQMQLAQEAREHYLESEAMWRDKITAETESLAGLYYWWKAQQYEHLADVSCRVYEKWKKKAESFDEIALRTAHLFMDSSGLRTLISKGLSETGDAFVNGGYMPKSNSAWRNQLMNAGLRLARCCGDMGGKQGGPYALWKRGLDTDREYMRKIIHGYEEYADYSDEEIGELLEKLDSEGCGYTAFANIIVDEYRGKEKDFERTFGFPLFSENGAGKEYVNYNWLILDLYCASDNHNEKGFLWKKEDRYDRKEDSTAVKGKGTTRRDREYRFKRYMKSHNIDVKIDSIECNAEDAFQICKKELDKGNGMIIATHPVKLEDEKGDFAETDGGHAMTVAGLTGDGKIEVLSWGKKYFITPEDSVYDGKCSRENCKNDAYITLQSVSFP